MPDHATFLVLGEGGFLTDLGRLAGRLHVLVVHFPIALLALAAALETLQAMRRATLLSKSAATCLWVGCASGCVAAGMGWLGAWHDYPEPQSLTLNTHRWLGTAGAVLSVAAVVLLVRARRTADPMAAGMYRASLLLAACVVALSSHFGGSMVHGEEYVTDPLRSVLGMGRIAATPDPPAGSAVEARAVAIDVDFARDVYPILNERCIDCHGDVKRKGGLRLDSRGTALKGGKTGPAIVPGDPDRSQMIRRVLGLDRKERMPPDEEPLTHEQIETLRSWIGSGAAWPDSFSAGEGTGEAAHWAYVPVAAVPSARPPGRGGLGEIDRHILSRLEREGLGAAPEAARGVLLRRLALDLTGLPPTPEELDAFENDESPDAYERRVSGYLASPAYGERWARWWLDLARYADSRGYEKDQTWSLWPYRDWVIHAFNTDMRFDRFTIEQLAGDLLANPTEDQLVATGFSRCSMINEEGGVDPEEFRVNTVVDRANTVATVWLGTTLACAQCHDHKYDPFTQKDYYRFFAFFNSTPIETADLGSGETRVISEEIRVAHPLEERWRAEAGAIAERLAASPDDPTADSLRKRGGELEALLKNRAATAVMKELEQPRETRILLRGSFLSPGDVVTPGTPEALPAMPAGEPANRLGLARWLVSADNPLTARVTVNRVWAEVFGRGLVATDEDFGARGAAPTHPELLDYLAGRFVENGWSMKSLLREIVMSATYRRDARVAPEMLERDPDNALLARGARFRLPAETIRDQALAVSGLLSRKIGGPPVFPAQPAGIWGHAYSGEKWTQSEGEDRHRRGVYTFWKRSTPYPSFVAFDAPQRQVTCTRRPRTNTALQALTALNDPVFVEAAAGLAGRIVREGGDSSESRASFAMRVCTGRLPSDAEVARLVALFAEQRAAFAANPDDARALLEGAGAAPGSDADSAVLAAWTVVANVILNLDEVLTKG